MAPTCVWSFIVLLSRIDPAMGSVQYSVVTIAVLAVVISTSTYLFGSNTAPETPYSTLVAPDVLHRLGYFTVSAIKVPTYTFLVRTGQDYVLMDAGSPGREHTGDLMAAVREAVGDGKLRLLLLTHGHIDHVGAVPDLTRAYPELQVVMHAQEQPYVTGKERVATRPMQTLPSCSMHGGGL